MKSSNIYSQTSNDRLRWTSSCPFRCLWKLHTMGVAARTEIISAIYKKCDKKDIESYRPTSFLNLDYKIYTTTLKNWIKKH